MDRKTLEKRDSRFKESLFKKIINAAGAGILIGISHLPFWMIYGISDFLYLLMRFIVKYRHKVITQNLRNAFPEKSEKEIARIINKYYRHFCDLMLESVKMYSMSEKQMEKRIRFKGHEKGNELFEQGKSVIVLAMHYNNWEWCSSIQTKLNHLVLMVYNPIRGNYAMEKFLLHSREKWGGECVPVHKTARTVIQYNAKGRLNALWLAADQTPPANSKFWTIFLNQETPFFSGPEKIAHSTNQPVFFQHVKKTGRGRYEVEFSLLCETPKEMKQEDILLAYIRKSEEVIRQEPAYYLWSHRRWKHKRPVDIELIPENKNEKRNGSSNQV